MPEQIGFRRNMGLFMAVMIGIGATMGPGIFALPGELAHMIGPLGVLVYLAMGFLTVFTALNYSELSAAIPLAGGGYSFTHRTLNRPVAFFTGWFFWIGNTLAPTLTADIKREALVPSQASGFGDDGQFMHAHSVAAAAVRQMDMRMVGPLVNFLGYLPETQIQDFYLDEWAQRLPPNETVGGRGEPISLIMNHCVWAPVPDNVNRIYTRVQVQNWTDGGTIRELEIRCYSLNRRPVIGGLIRSG